MLGQILAGQIDPIELVALLIALVFGISVHEFAHAAAATWLGDPLPGRQGRLTLSPAAHLDVMGSLMFFVAGFGWGKPVQYNPYALRASPRVGPAIVAAAGPLSNIIVAVIVALVVRLLPFGLDAFELSPQVVNTLFYLLIFFIYYNLILSFFNLIPVFPLDGFTILQGLLPPALADAFEATRQYGFFVLLLLFFAGSSVVGPLLYRPVAMLMRLLVGIEF
ncbi:MAG: site-2 protease family protein [Anaerolineales bacterium]|nr:site-2 protease family protein [Anaerolineales bacterium]